MIHVLRYGPAATLTIGLLAATAACDADDDRDASACTPAVAEEFGGDTTRGNVADVTLAEFRDGCLYVEGRYAGGCVDDDLQLGIYYDLALLPRAPYVATLFDAADDPCEAVESGGRLFDISAVVPPGSAYAITFSSHSSDNVITLTDLDE